MGNACCSEAAADSAGKNKTKIALADDRLPDPFGKTPPKTLLKALLGKNPKIDLDKPFELSGKEDKSTPAAQYKEKKSANGSQYRGQMQEGMRWGYGRCSYVDGTSVYEGQWYKDKCHGFGKFRDAESEYVGEWNRGQKHGTGEEKWFEDGTCYTGDHVQGKKHGHGRYVWEDGGSYEGEFQDDVVEGKGVFIDSEGTYTGQFHDNMQHGFGRLEGPSASGTLLYEGEFYETLKHGEGTMTWADGLQYKGQWLNGVQHGAGVHIDTKTGKTERVEYRNGSLVGGSSMGAGRVTTTGGADAKHHDAHNARRSGVAQDF